MGACQSFHNNSTQLLDATPCHYCDNNDDPKIFLDHDNDDESICYTHHHCLQERPHSRHNVCLYMKEN